MDRSKIQVDLFWKKYEPWRNKAIVCFDPGGNTGMCTVDCGRMRTDTLSKVSVYEWLIEWCNGDSDWDVVVYEKFMSTPGGQAGFRTPLEPELCGAFELAAELNGARIVRQLSSQIKQVTTKKHITDVFPGWKPGTVHELDAARHFYYAIMVGELSKQ